MQFVNESGLPAAWTMGFRRDGRELLIVVAKATYTLPTQGARAALADEQEPLVQADGFRGEPGATAPVRETDFAHGKSRCDVLCIGSAFAPKGRPVSSVEVGIHVATLQKQFRVVGHRTWRSTLAGLVPTAPAPFQTLHIGYGAAFGGTVPSVADESILDTFEANPVGCGWGLNEKRMRGAPLPNTEELDVPVRDHRGAYRPQAFGPVGRNWLPRRRWAGTYDRAWIESTAPLWPADFDDRYFQAAPEDQQIAHPVGGERVTLINLTADLRRDFELPRRTMPVHFVPHRGSVVTLESALDTLVLDPDAGRFTLTWRAVLPLGKSVFDVRETIVGERTKAWSRAMRRPGVAYHAGLAEAVRARKQRRGSAS